MIKVQNLNKYYNKNKSNEIHVINNTNIEISKPGLVTFLGASGAGKTTLLHVIGGLDKAQGSVFYDDLNVLKASRKKIDEYRNKNIGYIFQHYNLLPNLTVYENLKLQLELIGIYEKKIVDSKINECLKIVGMEKYKRRNVTALSGGQQQRVAIARALVKGCKIIIADEPTGNLDTKNSIEIMNILKILSKDYYVLLVTHNLHLANHYSDRIIKISDGKVIEDIDNLNNNSLLKSDVNAIYLKEYKNIELSNNNNKVDVFSKNDQSVNFKIVIENDAIYVESNSILPVKVINENTDKYFVEEDYEKETIVEGIENLLSNIQEQTNKQDTFKTKSKKFFYDLKKSFINIFSSSLKRKFLYFAFFIIGIILCFCLNALNISTTISNSVLSETPKNSVKVDFVNSLNSAKYGYSFDKKEMKTILDDLPEITGLVEPVKGSYLNFNVISNRPTQIAFKNTCFVATTTSYVENNITLKDNEIAISNYIANDILEYTSKYNINTYDDLKGQTLYLYLPKIFQGDVIIKEIVDSYDYTYIVSDYIYLAKNKSSGNLTAKMLNYSYIEDITQISFKEIREYCNGKGYYNDYSKPKCLMSESLLQYFIGVDFLSSSDKQRILKTYSDYFSVIGYIENDGFDVIFISQKEYEKFLESTAAESSSIMPYENFNLVLTEGSEYPVNNYEILLPNTSHYRANYKIGDFYTTRPDVSTTVNFKVTGYFELDYPYNTSYLFTNARTAYVMGALEAQKRIYENEVKTLYFYSNDIEKTTEYFANNGYAAGDSELIAMNNSLFAKIDAKKVVIVISICVIIAMILFVFFINRSKLMQDIYKIGVLRALGAKKMILYKDFILESLIITTLTIALGFTLTYFVTYNANNFIPGIAVDITYYYISIVAIYIVMFISSLAPIYLLLKKTPVEIISKYDI